MLEPVENNLLRFISFKYDIYRSLNGSYDNVLNCFNFTLHNGHCLLLLSTFLHKLLFRASDYPEMLSLIRFKTGNFNTRNSTQFYPIFSNNYCVLNSPGNLLPTIPVFLITLAINIVFNIILKSFLYNLNVQCGNMYVLLCWINYYFFFLYLFTNLNNVIFMLLCFIICTTVKEDRKNIKKKKKMLKKEIKILFLRSTQYETSL